MPNAREQALEHLYATAPEAFIAKRDALAKELANDGDDEGAADLRGRRKPTQLAYVLNQLARRAPDDIAALVDVGRELARAQRAALRGGRGPDLREAIGHQRAIVRDLASKTAALMRDLGMKSEGHLDDIAGALQAALVDPAVGAALEEGRLEKVPEAAAGFPGAAPQPVEAPETRAKARETRLLHRTSGKDARRRAREAAARAKAAERAARLADQLAAREARTEAARAKRAEAADARRAAEQARQDQATRALAAQEAEASAREEEATRLAQEAETLAVEAKRATIAAAEAKKAAARAKAAARHARAAVGRLRRGAGARTLARHPRQHGKARRAR
jgi:hypothetical protein